MQLKFKPRKGVYQNSNGNVTYNPETREAYSYKWWCFTKMVGETLIFNNARYSSSTDKHQNAVWHHMNGMCIPTIYLKHTLVSLTTPIEALTDEIECLERENTELWKLIHKKGTRKSKNIERLAQTTRNQLRIKLLRKLITRSNNK